jgi:predicted Rossmann fold flavoprotein
MMGKTFMTFKAADHSFAITQDSKMREHDLVVVGGGPAGLMAAGQGAEMGAKVLLLEKMESPGRKLLLTGKNRCNLTNTDSIQQALKHFNRDGRFLTQLYYRFFEPELRAFFANLDLPTVELRGGRVFPVSEKAADVLQALLTWISKSGVTLQTGVSVQELIIEDGKMVGVQTNQGTYHSPAVILAAGGKAYPGTGSTGDGYQLAKSAGHTIHDLFPALVPLVTAGDTAQNLQGLSLKNVLVSLYLDGKKETDLFGEMLFTHFGLSGPVILTLSRQVVLALKENKKVEIQIDLKPALDHPALDQRIIRDIQDQGRKQFSTLLSGLLPAMLIPICVEQTGVPWDKTVSQLTSEDRSALRNWLKDDFRFEVLDDRGFEQAIITAGGVHVAEVDAHTMESKLVKGLYFAGEILNVDGDTGGYNLQAAFSTGWAAGRAAGSTWKS